MTHTEPGPGAGCWYATIIMGGLLLAGIVILIGYVVVVGL